MTTVNLSEKTIKALQTLHNLNPTLRINHEETNDSQGTVLRSKSVNKTTCCRIDIDEEFPRDVHIYNLGQFVSILNIVKDPVIDLSKDNSLVIKSKDGKQRIRYIEANPAMVESYVAQDPSLSNEDITFTVTEEQFKSVMQACSTLSLEFVGFQADGQDFFIAAFNKNEDGDDNETNNYKIELGKTDLKFNMFYKLGTQKIDMLSKEKGDLEFSIDGSRKLSEVKTEDGKVFWFTFNASSEWESEED